MLKSDAIQLLGGSVRTAAAALGIFPQAIYQWPDVLSEDIENRVLAHLARKHLPPETFKPKESDAPAAAEDRRTDHARAKKWPRIFQNRRERPEA